MHRFLRLTSTFIILLLLSAASKAQTSTFSKLVVFGDSISDTGNLALFDLPPPFFENRISNGLVSVDLIAQSIGSNADRSGHLLGQQDGGFNYAVSGGNVVGSDPEDLTSQVSAFLNRVNQQADRNALYVVIIGGNDLRDIRSIIDPVTANSAIITVITQLDSQLRRLSNAGARAFVIANVANIGRIPETLNLSAQDPSIAIRAEQYVRQYNTALSPLLDEFAQTPELAVVEFDLFQALEDVLNNADSLGFSNSQEGCFNASDFSVELECLLLGFDSRVFFDNIHPSALTHRLISPLIIAEIPDLPQEIIPREPFFITPILPLLLED